MRSVSHFFFASLMVLCFLSLKILFSSNPELLNLPGTGCVGEECNVLGETAFCGDFICNGFETCATCELDCGVCPESEAWWQVWGGHLLASADTGQAIVSAIPGDDTCIEPDCYPFVSSVDRAGIGDSDGFLLTGGGSIAAGGWLTYREPNTFAEGTLVTRLNETYSFFYRQYSLGLNPDDDFAASADDAQEPIVVKEAYFHSGDLTIQSSWDVTSGESYVIFVDGDLYIQDPGGLGELITVSEGGFLAFVVTGDINISEDVGHSVLANTAGNIEGVYVADGTITVASNGAMDLRFVGEGTFVGWEGVMLGRDFNGGVDNDYYPAEMFVFRPDLVKNTPEKMMRSQMLRQES